MSLATRGEGTVTHPLRALLAGGGAIFINLDRRTDRRKEAEDTFEQLGLGDVVVRLSATEMPSNPLRGCLQSHLRALRLAQREGWKRVFITEDDVALLGDAASTRTQLHDALACIDEHVASGSWAPWDVLLLAGNNAGPFAQLAADVVRVANCQACTAYIVQAAYIPVLIQCWEKALAARQPLDIAWKALQRADSWLFIVPPIAVQRASYSDIQGRLMDYGLLMTDWSGGNKGLQCKVKTRADSLPSHW